MIWLAVILLASVLLIPLPRHYKDGGTVEYHAALYQIFFWHAMIDTEDWTESVNYYYDGPEVRILGFTVYNGAECMQYRYCD